MAAHSLLLTLNAGSSSVKFAVYATTDGLPLLAAGQVEGLGTCTTFSVTSAGASRSDHSVQLGHGVAGHAEAVHVILRWLEQAHAGIRVAVVSHRVVHGGIDHRVPMLIDDALFADLERLVPLAPLHQPHNLAAIRAARMAFPVASQIACFDTSFHRNHSFVADTFALPRSFYDEGVRRYGFHGLSYEFMARRLRAYDPVLAHGRVIVAHLGNGASMCAMREGRSVASTMGFSALDGLPMGTRCGQLDPLAYFAYRGRREIGGLAASLGGLDALVLTGGIGENAAAVRAAMLGGMDWMGIQIDPEANQHNATVISLPASRVTVVVFRTDEERMLAEHAAELVGL